MLLTIASTCHAARLDSTYLPPGGTGSAGGAGLIHPPGRGDEGGPIKHGGPIGYGGPSSEPGHGESGGFGPGTLGGGAYGKFE